MCYLLKGEWEIISNTCGAPTCKMSLENAPPFTICGVDFTGALYYKTEHSNTNKAYVCLFTCAVTRAVHLEIVTDMTAKGFLRAF